MPDVLIASDAPGVIEELEAVLGVFDEISVRTVGAGTSVMAAVRELEPHLVILDLQIGNMGGMATCMELRLEESSDRLPHIPVLMLLDRRADVFLARRSDADGWIIKPLDPIRIRRAVTELLAGRTWYDESYRPPDVIHAGQPVGSTGASETAADRS